VSDDRDSNTDIAEPKAAGRLRLRLPRAVRDLFDERLPKGVGWSHVFGSTLLALIGLQVITGVLLSLNYAGSTSTAWESVRYIQDRVVFGAFVRGIHHWAASASIVVAALHLGRVFLFAAYRAPRRWTWVAGVLLLFVLLGFGLTGYLLPWDLKADFGTKVATEIPGSLPVIGPYLLQIVRGSPDVGPFTLTRFYSAHVILLPAAMAVLLAAHLYLVRRHGITPPWTRTGEAGQPEHSFFPLQAAKDSVAILVAMVVVFAMAGWIGAPLEAKADPTNASYVPRPDWYFLGLQHMLRIFQGKWQILGTAIIPGVSAVLLLVWPWLDRTNDRRLRSRPVALTFGTVCAATALGMTFAGYAAVRDEERRMTELQAVPSSPISEPADDVPTSPADLVRDGERLYVATKCDSCHGADREELMPGLPPDLSYAGSKLREDWMRDYLVKPHRIRYQSDGVRPLLRMPDFLLSNDEARALAAYLATRTDEVRFAATVAKSEPVPEQIAEGRRLFANYQCLGCHALESDGNRIGPDLTHVGGRLRAEYLDVFLREPEAVIPGTSMKNFELWDDERAALVAFLRSQK
jgi:ubiquinol-cytochrome c reductase cytochrome b subunit